MAILLEAFSYGILGPMVILDNDAAYECPIKHTGCIKKYGTFFILNKSKIVWSNQLSF